MSLTMKATYFLNIIFIFDDKDSQGIHVLLYSFSQHYLLGAYSVLGSVLSEQKYTHPLP